MEVKEFKWVGSFSDIKLCPLSTTNDLLDCEELRPVRAQ